MKPTRVRLILYLSGRWSEEIEDLSSNDDLFFYAPGLNPKGSRFDWNELPRTLGQEQSELAAESHTNFETRLNSPPRGAVSLQIKFAGDEAN